MARARLPHRRRDGRPRRPARSRATRSSTGRRSGLDLTADPAQARSAAATSAIHCIDDAGPRPRAGARQQADRARAPGARAAATPVELDAADPQRQPHRRHDAVGARSRAATAARACRRRHDPASTFTGSAGQSFGAFLAQRASRCTLEGDANDYFGKGLSGGTHRRLPAARRHASCPRRTSSSATSRSTARPAARSSCRGHGRRALLRAQQRRHRGRRGRRRPRLRVHDRRHASSCSARPAATSPPA